MLLQSGAEANVILASGLMTDLIRGFILRRRDDPAGTYQRWFLWDERLKNFRSIRRGLQQVVSEIADGSSEVAHRDSSLETVIHSIAEQCQIFQGSGSRVPPEAETADFRYLRASSESESVRTAS